MVALAQRGHTLADIDHDARALVPQHHRELPFRVGARQRVFVGVADAGRLDLDQHLSFLGTLELDLFDDERRLRLVSHCCADLHAWTLSDDGSEMKPQTAA